jgi:hypothetical protein
MLIWDLHVEALLGCNNDLDHRESVDIQVIGEGLVQLDVLGRYTGDLADDFGESTASPGLLADPRRMYPIRWSSRF